MSKHFSQTERTTVDQTEKLLSLLRQARLVARTRGALEICEDLMVAEQAVLDLTIELEELVQMPRQKFIAGMKELLRQSDDIASVQ